MSVRTDRLILEGEPEIEVRLRRHARARRLSLRVSRLDGRVTLTLPHRVQLEAAARFLAEQGDWVRGHVGDRRPPPALRIGGSVPVEGVARPLIALPAGQRRPALTDQGVVLRPDQPAGPQLVGLLRVMARDRLARAAEGHACTLNQRIARISLRDTRSRWGSCTSDGRLMFSWRLIMAPPEILDYVAAHEVAHLVEMNHSPAFWRVVAGICPGYRAHRAWLRQHGAGLHAHRFAA
ncbi:MAG: M48 family metallopeptidase [Qingshengfaniella sp.]